MTTTTDMLPSLGGKSSRTRNPLPPGTSSSANNGKPESVSSKVDHNEQARDDLALAPPHSFNSLPPPACKLPAVEAPVAMSRPCTVCGLQRRQHSPWRCRQPGRHGYSAEARPQPRSPSLIPECGCSPPRATRPNRHVENDDEQARVIDSADPEAHRVKKGNKACYGYRDHTAVDHEDSDMERVQVYPAGKAGITKLPQIVEQLASGLEAALADGLCQRGQGDRGLGSDPVQGLEESNHPVHPLRVSSHEMCAHDYTGNVTPRTIWRR